MNVCRSLATQVTDRPSKLAVSLSDIPWIAGNVTASARRSSSGDCVVKAVCRARSKASRGVLDFLLMRGQTVRWAMDVELDRRGREPVHMSGGCRCFWLLKQLARRSAPTLGHQLRFAEDLLHKSRAVCICGLGRSAAQVNPRNSWAIAAFCAWQPIPIRSAPLPLH